MSRAALPLACGTGGPAGSAGKAKRGSSRSVAGFQAVLVASTRARPPRTGPATGAGVAATRAASRGSAASGAKSGSAARPGMPAKPCRAAASSRPSAIAWSPSSIASAARLA